MMTEIDEMLAYQAEHGKGIGYRRCY